MTHALDTLLLAAAADHADRDAVVGAAPVRYVALAARVAALADQLRDAGVEGGRVGLLLPNVDGFPVALYGLLRAGASAVLLNPLYSRREVAEYLADAGARACLTIEPLAELLPDGLPRLLLDPATGGAAGGFSRRPLPAGPAEGGIDPPDREAAVIYTAAMDGWARGARLTHRSLAANLFGVREAMALRPDERVLGLLPFIHAFGLTVTLTAPLSAGAAVVPVERFHPVRVLDAMERTGATVMCGVPAVYLAMIAAAERHGVPRNRLRLAICGGAPLAPEVARRWEDTFGLPLREGYGLTEGSPVCLFNRGDRPNRPGTMGVPFPGVDVTIRDEQGGVLPAGEVGEICVEGANVFAGYVGDGGRDPRHFHGAAFRTGDLGSEEPDGAVRFRGVRKAMFTRSGFNIYPREIERVLREDPRIAEATVTAAPDPAKENEVVATVVPAPGASLTEEDVRALARERLAAYKQPGRIVLEE